MARLDELLSTATIAVHGNRRPVHLLLARFCFSWAGGQVLAGAGLGTCRSVSVMAFLAGPQSSIVYVVSHFLEVVFCCLLRSWDTLWVCSAYWQQYTSSLFVSAEPGPGPCGKKGRRRWYAVSGLQFAGVVSVGPLCFVGSFSAINMYPLPEFTRQEYAPWWHYSILVVCMLAVWKFRSEVVNCVGEQTHGRQQGKFHIER